MKKALVRTAGVVAAFAAGFMALYGVVTLLSDSPPSTPEIGEAQVGSVDFIGGGLLTSNRDHLSVCVQQVEYAAAMQVPGASTSDSASPSPVTPTPAGTTTAAEQLAANAVSALIPTLEKQWAWDSLFGDLPAPQVVIGCGAPPQAFAALELGLMADPPSLFDSIGRAVSVPSSHRLHVYIITPAELERFGGRDSFRLASEEALCSYDECTGVTYGLYVTTDNLEDQNFMKRWLSIGLGLASY